MQSSTLIISQWKTQSWACPLGRDAGKNPAPQILHNRRGRRACFENGSGKGLRTRRGGWRGSLQGGQLLICSDSTKENIPPGSSTEQRSHPPRPAARRPEIFSKHALSHPSRRHEQKFGDSSRCHSRLAALRRRPAGKIRPSRRVWSNIKRALKETR
jgi:hypothetical protein